jgi:hypothetical protein
MKKKIIFGVTACLFAAITMFNISFSQQANISDVSLENIVALTTANAEIPDGTNCGTNYKGLYCGTIIIDSTTFYVYWP